MYKCNFGDSELSDLDEEKNFFVQKKVCDEALLMQHHEVHCPVTKW